MTEYFIQDGDTNSFVNNDRDFAAGYIKITAHSKFAAFTYYKVFVWQALPTGPAFDMEHFTEEKLAQTYVLNRYIASDFPNYIIEANPGISPDDLRELFENINANEKNETVLSFSDKLASSLFADEGEIADTAQTEA